MMFPASLGLRIGHVTNAQSRARTKITVGSVENPPKQTKEKKMNAKTRKITFIGLTSLLILIAALPINSAAAKGRVSYDFSKSLEDLVPGTDDVGNRYSLSLQYEVASPFGGLPNG